MLSRWSVIRGTAARLTMGVVGLLLFLSLSCWADVSVEVASGVLDAAPGEFATPVFSVTNAGPGDLSLTLDYDAPDGWQILGTQSTLDVASGEEEAVFATVIIPAEAPAGDYAITLTVTAAADASDTSTASAQVRVEPVNEIQVLGPNGARVAPGGAVTYEFTVANRGNAQDSILIEVMSSRGFPFTVSETAIELTPQERVSVEVRLEIPAGGTPGQDVLTLTATSSLYDGVEDDAVVFTTILPPTPDAVGGTLIEILPGRFRLSIEQDVFDGTFDSSMSFSTSGRVGSGFFSSFVSASDPFGPTAFDVTSYSILYRQEPGTAAIGNVSKRLSELVSVSCEGGSFAYDGDTLDLAVVAGFSGDSARFGGLFAMGPDVANVGFTFYESRSATSRSAIASATADSEPLEDWTLFGEAALAVDDGITSRAFLFGTEIDVPGYFLSGEAYSIGTAFPGSGTDSAGISLSQRLRLDSFSLSLSLAHEWDNVGRNPFEPTRIDDDMGFNISATPIEDGPRLTSTLEFGWSREDDLDQRNEIDLLMAMGVRETDGVFPYTFSGEIDDNIDLANDTHTRTLTFSEGGGLSVDSFYIFLQLTQEKVIDLKNDVVLSGATDVSLTFRPEGTLHEASINLRNTVDEFDLTASLFIKFLEHLDITFDGSISWDRADADPLSFGWGITFNADLAIPLPFLVTKGRVEGTLFIDLDGDGAFGPNDRPIDGGVLAINGTEVSTDATGFYRFPPLAKGSYSVTLENVPADARRPDPVDILVIEGIVTTADIALQPVIVIRGAVFDDEDQNGLRELGEGGFDGVRVLLQREDGSVLTALSDGTGAFSFYDVPAGLYTASLDPVTLPERFEPTTPSPVVLDVVIGGEGELRFGGYIKPREVIITFQPPTADFEFEPAEPAAGESVTFDGTFSFDFDGEIVDYAWDFNDDGIVDSTGATPEWTFAAGGAYAVTLTVTDNVGSMDVLTRTITVSGEESTPEIPDVSPDATPDTPGTIQTQTEVTMSSLQPPIADFVYTPEQPFVGDGIAFDGSGSFDFDGEIAGYAWDFDADGIADEAGAIVLRTFPAEGDYAVTLTVTDDGGNADVLTRTVTVIADGASATGEDTGDAVDDGTDAPDTPADPDADDSGSGLSPPTADFSFMPGQGTVGEPVTFDGTLSSDLEGLLASYAWDFDGDGLTDATAPLLEHAFATPGDQLVTLTVTDSDGQTDTVTYSVPVFESSTPSSGGDGVVLPPIADFSYSPGAPLVGEPVEFNGLLSFDFDGTIVGYAWDFNNDGIIDSTSGLAIHVFGSARDYNVRLTITDNDGATDTLVRTITVQ